MRFSTACEGSTNKCYCQHRKPQHPVASVSHHFFPGRARFSPLALPSPTPPRADLVHQFIKGIEERSSNHLTFIGAVAIETAEALDTPQSQTAQIARFGTAFGYCHLHTRACIGDHHNSLCLLKTDASDQRATHSTHTRYETP